MDRIIRLDRNEYPTYVEDLGFKTGKQRRNERRAKERKMKKLAAKHS